MIFESYTVLPFDNILLALKANAESIGCFWFGGYVGISKKNLLTKQILRLK